MAGNEAGTYDVDRSAPVIASGEILVDAPVAVVWDVQTNVSAWTTWRDDVDHAELDGPFVVGSTFHWAAGGLEVPSTIHEVRLHRRIGWGGPAAGIDGRHIWEFTPEGERTRVSTLESWSGEPIEADVAQAQAMLSGHLAKWLADLKRTSEAAARS